MFFLLLSGSLQKKQRRKSKKKKGEKSSEVVEDPTVTSLPFLTDIKLEKPDVSLVENTLAMGKKRRKKLEVAIENLAAVELYVSP